MIVNSFYTLKVFNICHTFHRPNMLVTLIVRMSGTWNMEHGTRNIPEHLGISDNYNNHEKDV